jgi:hypothetical protein
MTPESAQEWWQAVRSIADLVARGDLAPGDEGDIRNALEERGFSSDHIGRAIEWVDMAALSGNLLDTLGMLANPPGTVRLAHPVERLTVHPELYRALELCRDRGLFGQELAERLFESVRTVDSRDWDEHDVRSFLTETLASAAPWLIGQDLTQVLSGKAPIMRN